MNPFADPMTQALEGFYNEGTLVRPAIALRQLLSHPRKFLQKYYVAVDERIGHPGGTQQVHFYTTGGLDSFRPGSVLGTKRFHVSSSFHFSLGAPPDGRTDNAHCSIPACYVPMLQATGGTNFNNLVWTPVFALVDLIITVQLSGCSFLWRGNGANFECAHYQPQPGMTGGTLQTNLSNGAPHIYGRSNYGEGHVSNVIGVRRNGQWRIYAQKVQVMTKRILNVSRLEPA